jgi:hypothetical protein
MSIVIDEVIADVQGAPSPAAPGTAPDTPPPSTTPAATLMALLTVQTLLREREARLAFD